jgi:phosphatidate phosphatase APP1
MYRKADIDFHGDWRSNAHIAINVKVNDFGGKQALENLMRDFACTEDEAQTALNYAWESQCEIFWNEDAPQLATEILKATFGHVKVYSEGRSGGWLTVYSDYKGSFPIADRDDVDNWDAIKVSTWGRFAKAITAEVAYLSSYEAIKELIEINNWIHGELSQLVELA